jgi:hypothetical protein
MRSARLVQMLAWLTLSGLSLSGCTGAKQDEPDGQATVADTLDADASLDDAADVPQVPDTVVVPDADAVDLDAPGTDAVAEVDDEAEGSDTPGFEPNCVVEPGSYGCPCKSNDDCETDLCGPSPHAEGWVCTVECPYQCDCSKRFPCEDAPSPFVKLCNPCTANVECDSPGNSGARCVSLGDEGAFCGTACQTDDDCPFGYPCKESQDVAGQTSKQCVVPDGGVCTCSEAALLLELSTECFVATDGVTCEGKRTCLGGDKPGAPVGGGLTACSAPPPSPEQCNSADDDCDGMIDEGTCDDGNPCTDDFCSGPDGCKYENNAQPCDADGSVCTSNDQCIDGQCAPGPALACDDKNACTTDTCDALLGCRFQPTEGLVPCDADENPCTANDSCNAGLCVPGAKKACDTGEQCVEGKCSILTGACTYTTKQGVPCNDGNPCTAAEKCAGESCVGAPIACDDQNGCTADSCDPKIGCLHTSLTTACDDGDACTKADACKDGACAGLPIEASVTCSDGNSCTTDSCDKSAGCLHKPVTGGACDDGNWCTKNDTCYQGSCSAGPNCCSCKYNFDCANWEDGNACNGTLMCDTSKCPTQCIINPATVVKCDTTVNTPCRTNACLPATGLCAITQLKDGTNCDDGDPATSNTKCLDGLCVGN